MTTGLDYAKQATSLAGTAGRLTGNAIPGISGANAAFGVAGGIEKGGVQGYSTAAIDAAKVANQTGVFGSGAAGVGKAAGAAGAALGVYSGIQAGGAAGYTQAGLSATSLAASAGAFGAASAEIAAAINPITLALLPVFMGLTTNGVDRNPAAYQDMFETLAKGKPTDDGTAESRQALYNYMSAWGELDSEAEKGELPSQLVPLAKQFGIQKSVNAHQVTSAEVGAGNQAILKTGGVIGNSRGSGEVNARSEANLLAANQARAANIANKAAGQVVKTTQQQLQTQLKAAIAAPTSAAMTFPGVSGGSSSMPLIMAGAGMATSSGSTDQSGTDSSGGGFSLSGLGSSLGNFASSNAGSLATFGTLAGLGEVQASQQKSENQQQANSISSLGQPYSQAGAGILSQLEGGAQVGGPLGQSIKDQTDTASELGQVAKNYGTGQLTSAQQQQVADFVKNQRAQVDSQLAASGNTDSSAKDAAYQQIDSASAQLTQQLTAGNLSISQQALTTVQQTYNGLLNQALTSSEFGLGAQEQAVQTLIQGDTQLSTSLNQLFAGLAQGFGTAVGGGNANRGNTSGGSGVSGGGGMNGAGVAAGMANNALRSGVAASPSGGGSVVNQGQEGGYGASEDSENQLNAQLDSSTWDQEFANQTDIQTELDQSEFSWDPGSLDDMQFDFEGNPFGD